MMLGNVNSLRMIGDAVARGYRMGVRFYKSGGVS